MTPQRIPASKADLDALISSKVEENAGLEYKDARSLDRKDPAKKEEISKDVSAFANSAGGILIYGIREYSASDKRHLPEIITPVDGEQYSREWLEQMIGQIQPRIEGIEIRPILVGPKPADFCYVVVIPQSGTAHQATDLKYYKRRNFIAEPMEDYEIRDIMNRQKHPKLSVMMTMSEQHSMLVFNVKNEGAVMAKHYMIVIDFPIKPADSPSIRIPGSNAVLIEDDNGEDYWRISLGNNIASPLFPQAVHNLEVSFHFVPGFSARAKKMEQASITIYADSMPPIVVTKDVKASQSEFV